MSALPIVEKLRKRAQRYQIGSEWGHDLREAAATIEGLYGAVGAMVEHLEQSLASFERDPSDSDFQDGFHAALTTPEMVELTTSLRAVPAEARGEAS